MTKLTTDIPNLIFWPIGSVALLITMYGVWLPGFNHVYFLGIGLSLGLLMAFFLPPAGRSYYG
ncbi:hypothetical protein LCGC14_0589160 [marine sediment metagenome]|uniref:Uncharacterized protein n=1 Tax=marine sediment metagenome TaxID=412755 RepID=A0A0F9RJ33_9ZZZZ